jgi:hypothetical protein
MKRKNTKRLTLNRESLRSLNPAHLVEAAGGFGSSSDNCTQSPCCTHGTSAGNPTYCICARCPSVPPC